MRIETNWRLAQRNRRIAQFLFFFSMAVLIGGFFIANSQLALTPETADSTSLALALILPWLVLPLGFISTIVSVRMTNLWIRKPRPEEAIHEALKGMSKKSVLYNYYHFPARHVLIAPQGVFAIVTRFQDGRYQVDGDKWTTRANPLTRFMAFFRRDAIGNPTQDAHRAATYVKGLIDTKMSGVEVQPLIIFVDPRATLEITNPTVPVLYTDDRHEPNLRDYLRDLAPNLIEKAPQPAKGKKKGDKSKPADKATVGGLDTEKIADAFEEATLASR
jgi:hypothetical protein